MVRGIIGAVALLIVCPVAFAQPYEGPPDGAAYWTVQAFKEHPIQGPRAAKGLMLWSHGVRNREPQYHIAPPAIARRFARAGWDVIKVQRNPRFERGWIPSGVRHVEDLVERANKAKAEGYRLVIAAGQSYGGAISIEASGKTDAIDGVLALSPGHGSDAAGDARLRMHDTLTDDLIAAIRKARAGRLVVLIAADDPLHPFEVRGPRLRSALQERGKPFVLFDEMMPLKGHSAGYTRQFNDWYGSCVRSFLERASVKAGETTCEGPVFSGVFALPRNVKVVPPESGTPPEIAALSGSWVGALEKRPVKIIVEQVNAHQAKIIYAVGPEGSYAPFYNRLTARWIDNWFEVAGRGQAVIQLWPPDGAGRARLIVTGSKGTTWVSELRREEMAGLRPTEFLAPAHAPR